MGIFCRSLKLVVIGSTFCIFSTSALYWWLNDDDSHTCIPLLENTWSLFPPCSLACLSVPTCSPDNHTRVDYCSCQLCVCVCVFLRVCVGAFELSSSVKGKLKEHQFSCIFFRRLQKLSWSAISYRVRGGEVLMVRAEELNKQTAVFSIVKLFKMLFVMLFFYIYID